MYNPLPYLHLVEARSKRFAIALWKSSLELKLHRHLFSKKNIETITYRVTQILLQKEKSDLEYEQSSVSQKIWIKNIRCK